MGPFLFFSISFTCCCCCLSPYLAINSVKVSIRSVFIIISQGSSIVHNRCSINICWMNECSPPSAWLLPKLTHCEWPGTSHVIWTQNLWDLEAKDRESVWLHHNRILLKMSSYWGASMGSGHSPSPAFFTSLQAELQCYALQVRTLGSLTPKWSLHLKPTWQDNASYKIINGPLRNLTS